jgi:protein-S-isoprenylcysteine O-methyltransferase Ste14
MAATERASMGTKVWIVLVAEFFFFAAILFGAAGTFAWIAGWIFLAIFFGCAIAITVMLTHHDPALLEERMKPIIQKGQPVWDKLLMLAISVIFLGWLILMPLDAMRFGWSSVPLWVQGLGAIGIAASMALCYRTFHSNTFLAPVVKIQEARGQKVIHDGPYAVIRHPLYAGVCILFPSIALLLGSVYGVAGALVLIICLVVRTALEDRELQRSLPGYSNYTHHVRYRLVPYLW